MEAIVEKIQEEVEEAADDLEDVPEALQERLTSQFEWLMDVDWATWDYRNVWWPTIVDWQEIGSAVTDATDATLEITEDLWDDVDEKLQYIGEEYLLLWWSELSQSSEFQNLIQWGVEVGPEAANAA